METFPSDEEISCEENVHGVPAGNYNIWNFSSTINPVKRTSRIRTVEYVYLINITIFKRLDVNVFECQLYFLEEKFKIFNEKSIHEQYHTYSAVTKQVQPGEPSQAHLQGVK